MKRFHRDKRASELTEAALTLPIVLLVLMAIIQFGIVVYGSQMAKEAARHGARMGSVVQGGGAAAVAASAAYQFAQSALPIGHPQVQILAPGGVVGTELRVRVTYQVPNLVGFPGLPRGPYRVFGEATARQEGW